MTQINRFAEEIERNYDVRSISANNVLLWPFLRNYVFGKLNTQVISPHLPKDNTHPLLKKMRFFKVFRNIFYNIHSLFSRKIDYLVFNDIDSSKIRINGKYVNRVTHLLTEMLGTKTLIIENRGSLHPWLRNPRGEPRIICQDIFYFLSKFPVFNKRFFIKNEAILQKILSDYNISLEYRIIIKRILIFIEVAKLFLRLIKPKAIFILEYENVIHHSFIYAASELNIPTFEMQYGRIDDRNPIRRTFISMDTASFPDYLLSYGNIKEFFNDDNYFISQRNVIPIGNFYFDYLKTQKKDDIFENIRWKYDKIVCITGQEYTDQQLLPFIIHVAKLLPTILFVFLPRDRQQQSFPVGNIKTITKKTFYDIIPFVDFHTTVYSTCAIESIVFGIPNILININNLSTNFYNNILDPTTTRYAKTPDEFREILQNWQIPIKITDKKLCVEQHDKRLRKFIHSIKNFKSK